MTHPDIILPRAVVEQALEALDISQALLEMAKSYHYPKVLDAYKTLRAALQAQAAEGHAFNDESPFCVKCGSTGDDSVAPVAHILPRMLKILKFKSMPVPVDPLPYDNGEEKTVPLYLGPQHAAPDTQAAGEVVNYREIADCVLANLDDRKGVLCLDVDADIEEEIRQEAADTIQSMVDRALGRAGNHG